MPIRGSSAGSSTTRLVSVTVLLGTCLTVLSCDDPPTRPQTVTDVGQVLFMGNSLTVANSLPIMVDSLAAASGVTIRSTMIAYGGYALIDHWDLAYVRPYVAEHRFDYVILQQGPSALPESRDSLIAWSKLWDPEIRAAGGIPGLYAVWPEKARLFAFEDVSTSYRLAAEAVDGLFFPAGDTWTETWRLNPDVPLYSADNFHPSVYGSYAAAVVIVSILAHRDPLSLSPDFRVPDIIGATLDSTLAATIRQAAQTVIDRRSGAGRRRSSRPPTEPGSAVTYY